MDRAGADIGDDSNRGPDRRPRGIGFEAKRGCEGFLFYSSRTWRHTGPSRQFVFCSTCFLLIVERMKKLAVIGSTGSIGQNTLRVVDHLPERFKIFAIAASSSVDLLAEQTAAFHPAVVGITDKTRVEEFRARCHDLRVPVPEVVVGQ